MQAKFMVSPICLTAYFFSTPIVAFVSPALASPKTHTTDFCPARLDDAGREQWFSRTLSTGASFSHGCTSCDIEEPYRSFLNLSGDAYWVRRNPVLYFLKNDVFHSRHTSFSIFENDPTHSLVNLMPEAQLKKNGYRGLWTYSPAATEKSNNDLVSLMSNNRFNELDNDGIFKQSIPLFGGVVTRFKYQPHPSPLRGILYAAYNEQTFENPYVLFDLSLDGARMQDLFIHYGDPELYKQLEKADWKIENIREELINKTVARFTALNPSLVLGFDALFWDSVARTFSLMQKGKPSSPYLAFVLNFIKSSGLMNDIFNDQRQERIFTTYLETMRRISLQNPKSTPVLLGRMMVNTADEFKRNASTIASIIASFLNHNTNRDFFPELYKWIKKVAYKESLDGTLTPRTEAYHDDVTDRTYTLDELVRLQQHLKKNHFIKEMRGFGSDPLSSGPLKNTPLLQEGLFNILILEALGDLPLFLQSLENSFNETNRIVEAFIAQTENPSAVQLVNANGFFNHFPEFLKPETMHPDVFGAKKLSQIINAALCE